MKFQYWTSPFGAVLLLLALLTLSSNGARASDFQSARTAALGGAGHAAPLLTDSIYLNPAYASFIQSYVFSANYAFYRGNPQPDGSNAVHGHVLNAAVQDGENELFQAGVGLTMKDDGKLVNVGASKALLKSLGVGLGGKFLMPNAGNGQSANDAVFSMNYVYTTWLQAAFIIDNVIDSSSIKAQGLYREYIVGTKFAIQNIAFVYIDPHLAPSIPGQPSFGHESGIELTPFEDLFLRFGMFRNSNIPELRNLRGRGYGLGVGLIAPKLSLDYSLKRVVDPVIDSTHTFGMTVYF